jgi:hypothetical protein
MTDAVELYGKHVRVLACREDNKVRIEVTAIYDPTYQKPVILIVDEGSVRSEVESLISEIDQLLRKALLELNIR